MNVPLTGPRHRILPTRLGTYYLAAEDGPEGDAIIGVWREDQSYMPSAERLGTRIEGPDPLLDAAAAQILEHLDGSRTDFTLPLRPQGTPFQQQVWAVLRAIPCGSTTTYGQIARQIGSPRAAQAVGRAVGTNPISVLVPCHRVLGSAGALTGYAGGVETKRALLELEGAIAPALVDER